MNPRLKIGLTIIAAILTFQYLLVPLGEIRRGTLAQVEQLRETVARKQALLGRQSEVETAVIEAAARLEEISARFHPRVADAAALQLKLQQQVEALVTELGARVVNVDWLPPGTGTPPVIRAPVRFRLEITPPDLARLLATLENNPHLLALERLNLTARARASELTAELVVIAHGLP